MGATIVIRYSSTPGHLPAVGALTPGELGVNLADRRIYSEDLLGDIIDLTGLRAVSEDTGFTSQLASDLAAKAPLASPALTGTPTAPTASTATSTTQIATTAFVKAQGYALDSALTNGLAGKFDKTGGDISGPVTIRKDGKVVWSAGTVTEPGFLGGWHDDYGFPVVEAFDRGLGKRDVRMDARLRLVRGEALGSDELQTNEAGVQFIRETVDSIQRDVAYLVFPGGTKILLGAVNV